ncbi:ABC transporter permease [Bryobacter aggregatus]|uniref:ABC transporter permease n=1 Tax=Bryobacter aggregatus TaxID=360054 RepID=UPI0004E18019|nr:ABC transporter permease [Bryobacter aggregatus]
MRGILDEIRNAFRGLLHAPLFTFVAVSSLALGIGANSAIFSLIDQVILKSLPVERPGELIQVFQSGSHYGSNSGPRMNSYPMYREFRDQSPVHVGMMGRREIDVSVSFEGSTERTGGELISGNYFQVLGVKAHLGRLIEPADDKKKSGHPVVVLGYDYWKNRFAGDPAIIGKELLINNFRMTVLGVSEAGFFGLDPSRIVSVRIPMMMKAEMTPGWDAMEDRRSRWVQIFARLKPGTSIAQAKAQMNSQFHNMRAMEVKEAAFAKASDISKQNFLRGNLEVETAANGFSGLRRRMAEPLWILMGVVGLVLLIACTNVANLLIARATGRRKEFAVRAALGASRWRLMRPLLVESLVLSCIGGICGLVLAYALNSLLLSFLPTGSTPLRIGAAPDWRVMAFTFGIACATGVLFGLFPAYNAGQTDAAPALKEEGRGMSTGSSGLVRKVLVGVQVALSILLLVAAGLFVRTLQNLKLTDTGLEPSRLITFQANPPLSGYDTAKTKQFMRDFKQRAEATPGILKVGIANIDKMNGNEWDSTVTVEGFKHDAGKMPGPYFDAVTPGYVETMGMKILQGRDFRDSDFTNEPPDSQKWASWRICMINQKFADTYFAGKNPIGYHLGMGGDPGTPTDIEIVGVFSNAKYMDVREDVNIQVLVPMYQLSHPPSLVAYVRTAGDESQAIGTIRNLVRQMDPSLPLHSMRSFTDQIDNSLSTERLLSFLASIFGIVATILAAIGLYGVLSLAVSRRQKEIGIRIALGAESGSVIGLVMKEILFLIAGGILVGVPAAMLLSTYVKKQLYGMEAMDPITFVLAVVSLILVALLASWLPTRRATKVNPIEVLRYE